MVVLAALAALLVHHQPVGRASSCAHRARTPPRRCRRCAARLLERGLRALWVIGAALLLAWIWEVDVNSMAGDTTLSRLLRGALHALVIVLVVELLWHVLRTWIDRSLAEPAARTAGTPEAAAPAGAHPHAAADRPQRAARRAGGHGGADGALGPGRRGRAADRGRRRGRRRDRLRLADAGQGRHLGRLLPARRCLPGRRVHRERQHPRHGRGLLAALDQAAPPSRLPAHGAVRLARKDHQLFARLGDRQGHARADLRHRPRQGEADHQADRHRSCWPIPSWRRTSSTR